MSLRNSLIAKIWASLEKSPFTVADFEVTFGDEDAKLCVIKFRHRKGYFFVVWISEGRVCVTEAPGEHRNEESEVVHSFDSVPARILSWTRNVRDELRTTVPVYAEIDELRKIIDEHVAQNVPDPSGHFSKEEADDLRQKLDELSARLEQLVEKDQLTQQELNRLNQEISSLKANVGGYEKGTWYKTAASKLWITVTSIISSPEGRKVLTQATQKALGLPAPPDG